MYTQAQNRADPKVQDLRREAGIWLKRLRESNGLSQRQLAEKLGTGFYSFISQLETGHGRIPPDRYEAWAIILGIPPAEFVKTLMKFYDPVTHRILFGN